MLRRDGGDRRAVDYDDAFQRLSHFVEGGGWAAEQLAVRWLGLRNTNRDADHRARNTAVSQPRSSASTSLRSARCTK